MIIEIKDHRKVEILRYSHEYSDKLLIYLNGLSEEARKRFGPHSYTKEGISEIFNGVPEVYGFIAVEPGSGQIIAYSLIRTGYPEADGFRYHEYGIKLFPPDVCAYAPSVADSWQNSGLGSMMFGIILKEINRSGFRTMILWGGVQATNKRAVGFYLKHEFIEVGRFLHNGENIDMMREL